MVNYQEGKIYKIVDNTTGNIYIGSTAEKYLSQRLQKHISCYKIYINNEKTKNTTAFEIIKNNNFEILLLETFPCNNKYELEQKERYYIENNSCVNKNIPTRTYKEYYEDNKDKLLEEKKDYYKNNKTSLTQKNKNYYENNKDKIKEYRENNKDKIKEYYKYNKEKLLEKITCDLCGSIVSKTSLIRHKKTEKCKKLNVCMILD